MAFTPRPGNCTESIGAVIGRVNDHQTSTTGEMARNVTQAADGSTDRTVGSAAVSLGVDSARTAAQVSQQAAGELTRTVEQLAQQVGRFTV